MTGLVVVGDVLLDRDLVGTAERLCPDAPVPVVEQELAVDRPGGAGLAATLAAKHGAQVTLISAFAGDEPAQTLRGLLGLAGVETVDCGDSGPTCEKVRVRAGGQSLLRVDRGGGGEPGEFPDGVDDLVACCDALLVADYGRGLGRHASTRRLARLALSRRIPIVWDPHPRGGAPVPGITVVTPNRREAVHFDRDGDAIPAGWAALTAQARRLRAGWRAGAVAVTCGAEGALLVSGDGAPLVIPVDHPVVAADSCGAGDAFAAATAVALCVGAVVSEAVQAGVIAASQFVAAGGASSMEAAPPAEHVSGDPGELAPAAARLEVRRRGGTVVATGGCFDVLHAGHVRTLERARRLGDHLVVLLNSDASVRRLKGPGRPVQGETDRADVLRSLACVDEVVIFGDDTPVPMLERLRPDVFVKGGDYAATAIPEQTAMASWGGAVVTVPFLAGRSTTRILERIGAGGEQ